MDSRTSLAALDALERRFDGPVPRALHGAAMGGPARATAAAIARSAQFDRLARHATAALARARAQGSVEAGSKREARLARDLRLYREAGIACRDVAGSSRN